GARRGDARGRAARGSAASLDAGVREQETGFDDPGAGVLSGSLRILVCAAAIAAVAFLAFQLLDRSSRLHAPRSLGAMTLVDENPSELGQTRSILGSRGLHDVLIAVYARPGVSVVVGRSGFTLLAAHTDQAAVDMRQAV